MPSSHGMDIGIMRADTPAQTEWQQPPWSNPIMYSDDPVFTDQNFPIRCFPSYVALFHDPSTKDTYMTVWNADFADQNDTAVYLYKLERNLLRNGDASRCVDVAPFTIPDGSPPEASLAILRHSQGASDGNCYFASQRGMQQDIALNANGTASAVSFGGKFAGRTSPVPTLVTGFPWSRNLQTLGVPARMPPADGRINVILTELGSHGETIAEHTLPIRVTGAYPADRTTTTVPLNHKTKSLRYRLDMTGNEPAFTVLADEMFVRPL